MTSADPIDVLSEHDRFDRINHLLQQSKVYSSVLQDRLTKEREAREKRRLEEETAQATKKDRKTRREERERTKKAKARKATEAAQRTSSRRTSSRKKTQISKSEIEDIHHNKKAVTTKIGQPQIVTGAAMYDYQIHGMEWMASLYENGLNGILADEMGLGKTLQTIAFISFLIEKNVGGPFLVVVPLSTLNNWENEFKKFAPAIPTVKYHGDKKTRHNMWQHVKVPYEMRGLAGVEGDIETYPVVLTTYETITGDQGRLRRQKWKYLIVDEGHRIKNVNCKLIAKLKKLDTSNRLLLTGTPLQNNLTELWSLLNFLLPDVFTDLEMFQSWFDQKQDDSAGFSSDRSAELIGTLHSILKPFLLRRLKTEVHQNLPDKREYTIYIKMAPIQAVVDERLKDRSRMLYKAGNKSLKPKSAGDTEIVPEKLGKRVRKSVQRFEVVDTFDADLGSDDDGMTEDEEDDEGQPKRRRRKDSIVKKGSDDGDYSDDASDSNSDGPDQEVEREGETNGAGVQKQTSSTTEDQGRMMTTFQASVQPAQALGHTPDPRFIPKLIPSHPDKLSAGVIAQPGALPPPGFYYASDGMNYPISMHPNFQTMVLSQPPQLTFRQQPSLDIPSYPPFPQSAGPVYSHTQPPKPIIKVEEKTVVEVIDLDDDDDEDSKVGTACTTTAASSEPITPEQKEVLVVETKIEVSGLGDTADEAVTDNTKEEIVSGAMAAVDVVSIGKDESVKEEEYPAKVDVATEVEDVMDNTKSESDEEGSNSDEPKEEVDVTSSEELTITKAESEGPELDADAKQYLSQISFDKFSSSYTIALLRKVANSPHLVHFPWVDEEEPDEKLITYSGKMIIFDQLCDNLISRGHKILVFSQFTTTLDFLAEWCTSLKGYDYCMLEGSMGLEERQEMIDSFNSKDGPSLFLITTRAGGTGINLTAADSVIIFDSDWNPQQDKQAIDRSHRIGQTKPCVIYRLISAGTVEEMLLTVATQKKELDEMVIQAGDFNGFISNDKSRSDVDKSIMNNILAGKDYKGHEGIGSIDDELMDVLLDRSDEAYAGYRNKTIELPASIEININAKNTV